MEKEKLSKKEFALNAIAPYFNNPTLCAIENNQCEYITSDGRMCVAGRFMNTEFRGSDPGDIDNIISNYKESVIFIHEACGILNSSDWKNLQLMHDTISRGQSILSAVELSGLFTLEELEEAAGKL